MPDDPQAARIARRAARRAEIQRRRRRAAAGALLALALIVVLVLVLSGGGSGHRSTLAANSSARVAAPRPAHARPLSRPLPSTPEVVHVRGLSVPILMYHVIAAPPPGAPFPGLYVPPAEFAGQMDALARAGWHAITLDQLERYRSDDAPLPPGKPIVVTFDNGYQSQYTKALPVLERLGWRAVENIQLTGLPPSQGGLSRAQVRGLVAAGWELDTQGFSHADLIRLSATDLHYQVAVARTVVQQRYHVPVNWFCYPSGHYDTTVIDAVRAAGYAGSTTVVPGWAAPDQDPYRLERLRVLGGTSPSALLSQLADTRGNGGPPPSYTGA